MQPGAPALVRDADVGAHLDERLDRGRVARAEVRGGEDAHAPRPAREERAEIRTEHGDPAPLHERDEQVDAIRRRELERDLLADAQVARAVDEQVALAQRELGPRDVDRAEADVGEVAQREEQLCRFAERFVGGDAGLGGERGEELQHLVDERDLEAEAIGGIGGLGGADVAQGAERGVVEEAREEVRRFVGGEGFAGCGEGGGDRAEGFVELGGDRSFVEAWDELHGVRVAVRAARVGSATPALPQRNAAAPALPGVLSEGRSCRHTYRSAVIGHPLSARVIDEARPTDLAREQSSFAHALCRARSKRRVPTHARSWPVDRRISPTDAPRLREVRPGCSGPARARRLNAIRSPRSSTASGANEKLDQDSMGLAHFSVTNYRSFLDLTSIELRPLTLFFGYNSVGKSSLLRSLPLLASSAIPRAATPLALDAAAARGASFADICSRLSDRRELEFRLQWDDAFSFVVRIFDIEEFRDQVVEHFSIADGQANTLEARWEPPEGVWPRAHSYTVEFGGQTFRANLDFEGIVPAVAPDVPNEVRSLVAACAARLRAFSASVHWLGPLRLAPPRSSGYVAKPRRLGPQGEEAARILVYDELVTGPLLKSVSGWFERATKHRLELPREAERFRAVLSPMTAPHARVDVVDTGEGMAQVLPVLVLAAQALHGQLGEAPILAIEHPELHLHPAAEQELATFFVNLAAKAPATTTIIETHSPNFLLRTQLAIVRGELSPDAVAVYWVREGADGRSIVDRISFDHSARPSPSWPPGVFSEELEQARLIVEARTYKSAK